jgi:hypothetical protein
MDGEESGQDDDVKSAVNFFCRRDGNCRHPFLFVARHSCRDEIVVGGKFLNIEF